MKFFLDDEKAMLGWGKNLANACANEKTVIFLRGQLGAGKTTLVRGFLRGLDYEGIVKSPTYTLVESYLLSCVTVFHFDFYRLRDPSELEFIGIDDYFSQNAIFLVEWPEKGVGRLPQADLSCNIQMRDDRRELDIKANSKRGEDVLEKI